MVEAFLAGRPGREGRRAGGAPPKELERQWRQEEDHTRHRSM
jgi:hypothetical protein